MNILFVVSSMKRGGAERVASLLSAKWAESGHEVTLVTTYSSTEESQYSLDQKVQYVRLMKGGSIVKNSYYGRLTKLIKLRELIRDFDGVVLSFMTEINIAVLLSSIGLGKRVVVSERTFPPSISESAIIKMLRYILYPLANTIVVQTNDTRIWLEGLLPYSNVEVIPNPVRFPIDNLEPRITPEMIVGKLGKTILSVGRLDANKQFDMLISIFSDLNNSIDDCWNLVILGDGPLKSLLELQISQSNVSSRIHILGQVGNMADWYAAAEIFVSSSRVEGFPNALVEAMSYGVASISFDCKTGPSEIIDHGRNGLLVSLEGGQKMLGNAIIELIDSESLRKHIGTNAIEVREKYNIDTVSESWCRVFFENN